MKKFLLLFVFLTPLTIALYFCQVFVLKTYFHTIAFQLTTSSIYLFHFSTVIASYTLLIFVHKYFFLQTGYAFLAIGIIKMGLAILFLMPIINSNTIDKSPDILSFFVPFFLFLLLETIFAVKLLNNK